MTTNPVNLSRSEIARIEIIERDAWIDLYAAAPLDVVEQLGIAHEIMDDGAVLLSRRLDNIYFNRICALGVALPPREKTLAAAISRFDEAGVRNWIIHVAPSAGRLKEICEKQGLIPHRRTWAKFVRDTSPTSVQTSLTIREIGCQHAQACSSIATQAFGLSPVVSDWFAFLVGRARWHFFMGFDRDVPVATGALYINGMVAWLGIGATAPAHRKRGAQSALLAARIDAARQRGCVILTVDAGVPHPGEANTSYRNIERAGFRVAYLRPNFCPAPSPQNFA